MVQRALKHKQQQRQQDDVSNTNMVRTYTLIILSLILALMLSILPLPAWAVWFRPEWVVLAVIYWVMALPDRVSVGSAWLAGLFLDAVNGTVLGEHALAMTIVAYLVLKFHRQIRVFPLWQQALTVAVLMILYSVTILWIQGFVGEPIPTLLYWSPVLTSAILWPWVFIILRNYRRRYKVQ